MIEYRSMDKSSWSDGPWQSEPDKRQWTDADTGLPCLIVRAGGTGALCGYVGVSPSHPAHGKHYYSDSDSPPNPIQRAIESIDVHGGLTYAASCSHGPEHESICHIPEQGQPDDVWWYGFDCAHYMDKSPASDTIYRGLGLAVPDYTYRDIAYVENEVKNLARQLAAIAVLHDIGEIATTVLED